MRFEVTTKGRYDFIDVTPRAREAAVESRVTDGLLNVFVRGSTAALITMEFESGLVQDLIRVFEEIAPEHADYEHHRRWGDRNGAAHVKSALLGTDLNVPILDGELQLGTWQQIVLIDFDERPRTREIIVTVCPA